MHTSFSTTMIADSLAARRSAAILGAADGPSPARPI